MAHGEGLEKPRPGSDAVGSSRRRCGGRSPGVPDSVMTHAPSSPRSAPAPLARWRRFVRRSVRDGVWLPRAALLALLAVSAVRHLMDAGHRPVYAAVNLVTHEAGHALFYWTGSTVGSVAGGTILELAVPVGVAWMFVRQRDPFAVAVAVFWLGTALADVSIYVADARARSLPLVSLFPGPPIHDWHFLLDRAGWLELDAPLARLFRRGGLAVMALGILAGVDVIRAVRRYGAQGGGSAVPGGPATMPGESGRPAGRDEGDGGT